MSAKVTERSLVDELPRLLRKRGLSMRALARKADIDPGHLSRILNRRNYKSPSADLAAKVAKALDLPDDYFPEYREASLFARLKSDPALRDRLYRRYAR